ncbi:MAG: alpha-ketoacid dehydrogenase subunit beta [Chloroflexi bacterium]|nr:alpha-ketoacid dehydrogenase subunit beta [Chloroflexota bacterium]
MRELSFIRAENEAVYEEMERDPSIFVIGENVRTFGTEAIFSRLLQKFGPERVRDTAISEQAILGATIGSAATGMRPIAALGIDDFLGVCGDELLNQLQMRYMFGGKIKLPLTITTNCGAGRGLAAQHSKSLYGWLMAIKGLKIVAPSTAYDAKGLLKSAIREDNPVVFLTHTALGRSTSQIPDEEYTIPLGKADIKREGKDVTVVTLANMVHIALATAAKLQERGISIEIIDPRTVVPLDKQAILDSVRKTGRLVILTEEPITGSFAAEVAAIVAEEAFDFLDAPIKRVCAPDTPVPFSPALEKFWLPDEARLIKAIDDIM